jgi:hypothetical protein
MNIIHYTAFPSMNLQRAFPQPGSTRRRSIVERRKPSAVDKPK